MKKYNILQLLQDEYNNEYEIRKNNFQSCIPNFEQCVSSNIIPFLENDIKPYNFNFEFDLNSNDTLTKYKSMWLLKIVNKKFFEMISYTPNYFKSVEKEKGFDLACYDICTKLLYQNIYSIKKELKGLKTDDKTINAYLKNKELYFDEEN